MTEEQKADKKCPRCHCYRYPKQYINDGGRVLKTCIKCRDETKRQRLKYRCPHNRYKANCKDCGGSNICTHNRQRSHCRECKGVNICTHNRQKSNCKDCRGKNICLHNKQRTACKYCSDPVKITINTMICSSRSSDRKKDRYDADNHIDYCFVESLLEEFRECYYKDCKKTLQIIEYNEDLATIERLNNDIGHIKSNCVIACRTCNVSRRAHAEVTEVTDENK